MPKPELIILISLIGTFALLIGTFKYKVCFASAYLMVLILRPGIYYPILAQVRFELILAFLGVLMIAFSGDNLRFLSLEKSKITRYMLFFLIVILVSMLQAFDFYRSWNRVYTEILPNTLLVILIITTCKNERDVKILLWVFCITTFLLGYEPAYLYISGDINTVSRSSLEYGYAVAEKGRVSGHTALALYMLQGMSIVWYLAIACKKLSGKLFGFGLFAFCLYCVQISGARGGLVGLVVMLILISIFSKRRVLMLVSGAFALILILSLTGDQYLTRMASILEFGGSDLSANSRIKGLINGIELMIKRPILGVGPGCYPAARKAWLGWKLWSHNHYGQLMGELGLVGLITWFLFAKQYIKKSWELSKSLTTDPWIKSMATAILVTSVMRLVLGMVDHSLFRFIWYMLAAIVIVFERLNNENTTKRNNLEVP